jgi:vancomycin permeability regulator SanA
MIPLVIVAVVILTCAGIELYGHRQQQDHADVICVFGAAVWGETPSPELEARITWAARLYREGRASMLFLSGGPTGDALSEADVMGNAIEREGVPRSALIFDSAGTTTARTLSNLKRYMQGNSLATCIMVSSPFHMARIMILAGFNRIKAFSCPPATTPVSRNRSQNVRAIIREGLALFKDAAIFVLAPE